MTQPRSIILSAAVMLLAATVSAAQDVQGPYAKITFYFSPATTVLEAQAMTFSPRFENSNKEFGVLVETPLKYKRFGVSASWLQGKAKNLPGAADFITHEYDFQYYPTFNPLTDERIKRLTVGLTVTAYDYKHHTANIDATAGYFLLESQPGISKGNVFGGFSIGVAGARVWRVHGRDIRATGMISYVPTYFVHGNVEGQFTQDYIVEYRPAIECDISRDLGLTAGYQGMWLQGRVTPMTMGIATAVLGTAPSPLAIVRADGFYVGAYVKLGHRH